MMNSPLNERGSDDSLIIQSPPAILYYRDVGLHLAAFDARNVIMSTD